MCLTLATGGATSPGVKCSRTGEERSVRLSLSSARRREVEVEAEPKAAEVEVDVGPRVGVAEPAASA
jgi:hypothetical protein